MARTNVVDLTFRAEMSQFEKRLGELPGITKKEAKAAVKEFSKAQKAQASAAHRAARQTEKVWNEKLSNIRQVSTVVFGETVNDLEDVAGGLAALGGPAAAVTAGVAAIGVVSAAAVAGVVKLVAATDDLIDANEHLRSVGGFGISEADVDRVDRANAAMESVYSVGRQVGVVVGTELSPAVERGSRLLVAMGLMGLDAFNNMAEGGDMLAGVVNRVINGALNPLHESTLMLAESTVGWFKILGKGVPSTLQNWIDGQRESLTYAEDLGLGFERLEANLGDYIERADELIGKNKQAARSDEITKALDEQRRAVEQLQAVRERAAMSQLDGGEKIRAQYQAQIAEVQDLLLANQTNADVVAAAIQAEMELRSAMALELEEFQAQRQAQLDAAHERQLERVRDLAQKQAEAAEAAAEAERDRLMQTEQAWGQSAQAIGRLVANIASTISDRAEEGSKAQRRAAVAAFRTEQVAATGRAAMDGFLAIQKGIAQFGPPPSPLGIAAIATAAATTAASLAGIAAQSPPSFHTGGGVGNRGPNAPDELTARLRSNEGVLTRQGMQALAQLNRGQAGGGQMVVVQRYEHRTAGAFLQDHVQLQNSPLRRAIKARERVGHRKRR